MQRNCEDLKTGLNIQTYQCHHQEVDAVLFFIVHALRKLGYDDTVIIDAEETDVITLSSFVANKENELFGIRRKKSTFNYQKLCSPELATIIVQLHVLTGCHATSGFFGRGKKVIMRNLMKSLETANFYLKDFGKNLTMDKDVYENIFMFIVRFVYNDKKSLNLAESRSLAWKKMKKKSTRRLPLMKIR